MFIGILILIVNVGSRYIAHEMSTNDEEYSQNIFLRRLAIFAACFMGTRDLITSLLLTAAFVVLAGGLFRGKSVLAREGMANKGDDSALRAAAGLPGNVEQPAYNKEEKPMFK